MRAVRVLSALCAIALLIAIAPIKDYTYYHWLRVAIGGFSFILLWFTITSDDKMTNLLALAFFVGWLIFFPFASGMSTFSKSTWSVIDVVYAIVFGYVAVRKWET